MICAIVLAAGRSRRMGTQKLLLPFRGSTLIGHVVQQVLNSAVDRVYVVVGSDGEAIAGAIPGSRVLIVVNPESDSEMLDSVRCGLRALPEGCEGVLVVPGDVPGVTSALIDQMVTASRASGKGIVVPTCGGQRGHPLLFAARYCAEVLARYDGVGLRGLLQDHPGDVYDLPVPTPTVLADIDHMEDYRREVGLPDNEASEPGESPDGPRSAPTA